MNISQNISSAAIIIRTDTIRELETVIDRLPEKKSALVLSDVDLTLILPKIHAGSPLLFDWILRKTMRVKTLPKGEAISFLSPLNKWLDSHAESAPVEGETTRATIRSVQEKVKFMGCTARRAEVSTQVLQQLNMAQIPLEQNQAEMILVTIEKPGCEKRLDAAYIRGVLFTGTTYTKGEVVYKFLEAIHAEGKFTHIILIDDMLDNHVQMAAQVNAMGKKFIGLYYQAFKEKPLSDQEAIDALTPFILNPGLSFAEKYDYLIEETLNSPEETDTRRELAPRDRN